MSLLELLVDVPLDVVDGAHQCLLNFLLDGIFFILSFILRHDFAFLKIFDLIFEAFAANFACVQVLAVFLSLFFCSTAHIIEVKQAI